MFWRKFFIILLFGFLVIPKSVLAAPDQAAINACTNAGCGYDECSASQGGGKDKNGNYYCVNIKCVNNDICTFVDKQCNSDEDCKGYSTNDGGEVCSNGNCYLDSVGLERFNVDLGLGLTSIKADLQLREPKLSINIPGLNFSKLSSSSTITTEGNKTYLNIPYVAEYLAAVYKVGLVVISIIAVIMIVVTGVKIIVSGGEAKADGFRRIGQVAIGLFIGWGSYTILNIVNPNLVNFQALKVEYIKPIDLDAFGPNTLTESDLETVSGPYTPKYFSNCPVSLTNDPVYADPTAAKKRPDKYISKNMPRRVEFNQKILASGLITGTISERILKAVEATKQCQIFYENCGVASSNMYYLTVPQGPREKNCLGTETGKPASAAVCNILGYSVGNVKKTMVYNVRNDKVTYGGKTATVNSMIRGIYCKSAENCGGKIGWPEQCASTPAEAANKLKGMLAGTKWSDSWWDDLQPGDYLYLINWNGECNGAHSAVFLGWNGPSSNRTAWMEQASSQIFLGINSHHFTNEVLLGVYRPVEK